MIDIYDITLRPFFINGSVLGGDKTSQITYESIHKILGPTFPGQFIEEELQYLCNFDGASFLFQIPESFVDTFRTPGTHLPLIFPDSRSPILERIFIYPFDLNILEPKSYPDFLEANIQVVLRHLDPSLNTAVMIRLDSSDASYISLGMRPQDIISILGDPNVATVCPQTNSYRYEYRIFGIEFHISETSHQIFRIVLKNNLACSAEFGKYDRCPFRIFLKPPVEQAFDVDTPEKRNWICALNRDRVSELKHLDNIVLSNETLQSPQLQPKSGKISSSEKDKSSIKSSSKPSSSVQLDGAGRKLSAASSSADDANRQNHKEKRNDFDIILGPTNDNAYIDPLSEYTQVRELLVGWFGDSVCGITPAQLPVTLGCPFADSLLYGYPEVNIAMTII